MSSYDYKIINTLEFDLNRIKYRNIEIGSLLAPSFDKLISDRYYTGNFKGLFTKLLLILKALFLRRKDHYHTGAKRVLVYYKSGIANHHNRLHNSIESFDGKIITISCHKGLKEFYHDCRFIPFRFKFKAFYWIIAKAAKINRQLRRAGIRRVERISLLHDLVFQLFKALYWENYFETIKPVHIAGDYDRGDDSSPIFAVAKAAGIKSTVLQHGVINIGSGGYYPLIAQTVFVWGEIAKEQFLTLGLASERIKITGTPIMEKITLQTEQETQKNIKLTNSIALDKKLIVFAINPIKKDDLKKQLIEFLAAFEDINDCQPLIKLHPSQNKAKMLEDFAFLKPNHIISKEISNREIFIICDLLITHNSGIANEALLNKVNIVIFDNLNSVLGNGKMLHEYFGILILKSAKELLQFIKNLNNQNKSINISKLYYKIDHEASESIIENIEK